jgi:hypothetical protein
MNDHVRLGSALVVARVEDVNGKSDAGADEHECEVLWREHPVADDHEIKGDAANDLLRVSSATETGEERGGEAAPLCPGG